MWFAPIGNGILHIQAMKSKGIKWAGMQSDAWKSFFLELYPGMAYDLASVVLKPKKLDELMNNLYCKILPLLGLNLCINKVWRILPGRYHQGLCLVNFGRVSNPRMGIS